MKTLSYLILVVISCFCAGLGLTSCQNQESQNNKLKIAATSVPHAEILEFIKDDMKAKGVDLEIFVVEDYNTPNRALADKEVDANFFQHLPFLEIQKNELGYAIETFANVHIEPMGLYSNKWDSLKEIAEGATIAVPNDSTNQARALLLLEGIGLIKLNSHDISASVLNVSENPKHIKLIEIDSPLLARVLADVDFAAITTNFALQANFSPMKDALVVESSDSLFVNVIVIRDGDSDRRDLQILKELIQSKKTQEFILEKYKGAILPVIDLKD